MGNDSIIAFKTREQLRKYLGIFSPQFNDSRWKMEFLGQMLFGIQASCATGSGADVSARERNAATCRWSSSC